MKKQKSNYAVDCLCDVMKVKGLYSKEYVQNTYQEEIKLIESFKPDIIFGEFETVMPIAAKKMDIPYVSTGGTPNKRDFNCYGFKNDNDISKVYAESYNELLESINLNPIKSICEMNQDYNSFKVFVPSIPELEGFEESERYIYLGSVTPNNFVETNFSFEKKRPLIYVYLSVGELKPDVYQKIILDTFEGSEFDVIVTGGGVPRFIEKENNNVHFLSMVPSDKVLEKADIAIHHGGQNTTVQCIEYKVPSLIFPGRHFERFYNAEKASEIGCSLNLKVDSFNKEELLENCRKIMKDEDCKKALNKYSSKIKSYGGAARAAKTLLDLV